MGKKIKFAIGTALLISVTLVIIFSFQHTGQLPKENFSTKEDVISFQWECFLEEAITALDEVSTANITINSTGQKHSVVAEVCLKNTATISEEMEKSLKLLITKTVKDISEKDIDLSIV